MASKTRSLKLSHDLDEAMGKRAKLLGYPSISAYLKGLARYDLMVQGPHELTVPWSTLPLNEQDAIDQKLLNNTKKGIGERGQYLKRLLEGEL